MISPAKMARLKIKHLCEGLFFVPQEIYDFRNPIKKAHLLKESEDREKFYVQMKVKTKGPIESQGKFPGDPKSKLKKQVITLIGEDEKPVKVYLFGNIWDWMKIYPGQTVGVFGEIKNFGGIPSLANPLLVSPEMNGNLEPVYRRVSSSSGSTVTELVKGSLDMTDDATALLIGEIGLPEEEIAEIVGFDNIKQFLLAMHKPVDIPTWEKACKGAYRLAKEEVIQKAARIKNRPQQKASVLLLDESFALSPANITLTNDQHVAIKEIVKDIRSPVPMMRLLSGDVGTGKTLTFSGPCAAANRAGYKVAIVAPNEILVDQIVKEITETFPGTPVVAITSNKKPDIKENTILVGTSALIHYAKKTKWHADFLVIDEQHKMSREQRESISDKHTNILECTATAIPRSLALVTHGGMDVSILREAPVKRTIKTVIATEESRAGIYAQVKDSILRGEQVAVVYAVVDDDEENEALSVEDAAAKWEAFSPGRVVMVHGKMKNEEKVDRISAMKRGDYDIMVCSTVIEVGITIPKLTTMIIVDPDRYGLAQAHQLRGRLSRKGGDGVMILYPTKEISEKAMERLNALVKVSDGFELSDIDMRARGFGDLDSDSGVQNGETKFCFRGVQLSIDDLLETNKPKAVRKL